MHSGTQIFGQVLKAIWTFFSARFNGNQHLSSGVDCIQNERYHRWTEFPFPIAQLAEKALGLMGNPFQRRKRKETACTLDRVNCSKDASQQRRVLRVLLEFDKFLIETREVFMTLNEEFTNYFLILHAHFLHRA